MSVAVYLHAAKPDQNHTATNIKNDIVKLLEISALDAVWNNSISRDLESLKQRNKDIPESEWSKIIPELNADEYIELLIPIFEKEFTHDEILALIEFYESPVAKKWFDVRRGNIENSEALQNWREEKFYKIVLGMANYRKNNVPNHH